MIIIMFTVTEVVKSEVRAVQTRDRDRDRYHIDLDRSYIYDVIHGTVLSYNALYHE